MIHSNLLKKLNPYRKMHSYMNTVKIYTISSTTYLQEIYTALPKLATSLQKINKIEKKEKRYIYSEKRNLPKPRFEGRNYLSLFCANTKSTSILEAKSKTLTPQVSESGL